MAGDPINEALADILPGLTEAWVAGKERRKKEEDRAFASELLRTLQTQQEAKDSGVLTPDQFENEAVERGILMPEERTTTPTPPMLTPDEVENQLLQRMGPTPDFKLYADQLQLMREEKALQSVSPFVARAIGVDENQLRAGGTEGLKQITDVLKALPSTGRNYQALKVIGPSGKPQYALLNKSTGEIEPTDYETLAGTTQPVTDIQVDEKGNFSGIYIGPLEGRPGPGQSALLRDVAKRKGAYERKKVAAQDLLYAVGEAEKLVSTGTPRGKVGGWIASVESAANQLGAAARMGVGKWPRMSQIKFPPAIEKAAATNAKIKTITYNIALSLARFHEPMSSDIAARSVERELDSIDPTISGSDIQAIAALGQVTNLVLHELANEATALGEEFDIPMPAGTPPPSGVTSQPGGLSPEAAEGAALLERETKTPTFENKVMVYDPAQGKFVPKPMLPGEEGP